MTVKGQFFCLYFQKKQKNEKEIELKLNKDKQKLIRLVAVKNDKNFSKTKQENYKIGAIISKEK